MQNILLEIAYDGRDFFGSQEQRDQRTVLGVLREAVERLTGRKTRLIAAGRTDAGVHAEQQWVNFLADDRIRAQGFSYGLRPYLPQDLLCISSRSAPLDFHCRFSPHEKVYRYEVYNALQQHPRFRDYRAEYSFFIDDAKMQEALAWFVGEHDFSGFCKLDGKRVNARRRLDEITMCRNGNVIEFHFRAQGFLQHQVRMLVGALLEIGRGKLEEEEVKRALQEGASGPLALTMPACGLYLERVNWEW